MKPSWPGDKPLVLITGSSSMETRMGIKDLVALFLASTIGGILLGFGVSACERLVRANDGGLGLEVQKLQQTPEPAADLFKKPLLLGQEDGRGRGRRGDVTDFENAKVLAANNDVA